MAIIIDVLEDIIQVIPPPLNITSRTIKYTARENGGTMFFYSSGESADGTPLTAETELYPPSAAIAQFLFDVAEANGTEIPDLVTWVFIERNRKPVYRNAWAVVRNEVGDEDVTNVAPTWSYQTHILQQLATNAPLAANFQANAWRMGLIATKETLITPAVINGMTNLQRGFLYLLTLSFMGLGYTVGVDGSFILDEVLPD